MKRMLPALVALLAPLATPAAGGAATDRSASQRTLLISHARGGGVPNGPSSHAVISNDRRRARLIAFQSDASNLVAGDTNGVSDVFAVRRAGRVGNRGGPWRAKATQIVSRTRGGRAANGPSWAPAVDGAFRELPSCVAFLSSASNLVAGDSNGRVDVFLARVGRRGSVKRVSRRGRRAQFHADATSVAVSGDCSRIAFTVGGRVFVRVHGRTHYLGRGADPSFSTGLRNDLVYAGPRGVYLVKNASGRRRLVARGGRNPAYNDIKRRVVAYEKLAGGHLQVMWKDLGRRVHVASSRGDALGNRDSRDPVIGNSGYYIAFETDASNLGVNSLSRLGDFNGRADAYLYTNVRDITLVQSVEEKAVPLEGGGRNPSMSFYANYVLFDSPAPLDGFGPEQVWMRYLGPA
jgi:hypothetical protein